LHQFTKLPDIICSRFIFRILSGCHLTPSFPVRNAMNVRLPNQDPVIVFWSQYNWKLSSFQQANFVLNLCSVWGKSDIAFFCEEQTSLNSRITNDWVWLGKGAKAIAMIGT
jgi:hypothetical protein